MNDSARDAREDTGKDTVKSAAKNTVKDTATTTKKSGSKWLRLFLLLGVAGSLGYLRYPALASAPKVEALTVSSPEVTAGEPVTLAWKLSAGSSAKLLSAEDETALNISGTSAGNAAELEPKLSTTYTLIAQNRLGSDQQTQRVDVLGVKVASVSGGVSPASSASGGAGSAASGGSEDEASAPEGTLGVSLSPDGPFVNDEASGVSSQADERVLKVAPGGEFFIEVSYEDPDGVNQVSLLLVNGSPKGLAGTLSPDQPPFSVVGAPTGDCRLGQLPTTVRCVFRVRVAEDAQNIDALPGSGNEFAYVFRARAVDGLGNSANRPIRGYVAVTAQ